MCNVIPYSGKFSNGGNFHFACHLDKIVCNFKFVTHSRGGSTRGVCGVETQRFLAQRIV